MYSASSWAHKIGWIVKDDGRCQLTVAGGRAVRRIQDWARERQARPGRTGQLDQGSDLEEAAKVPADVITQCLATGDVPMAIEY